TTFWHKRKRCAMLWEVEIRPRGQDPERERVDEEYRLLTHRGNGEPVLTGTARGYLLEGGLTRDQVDRLTTEVLVDPLAEDGRIGALNEAQNEPRIATVLLKPGVMDPAALSVVDAARDLGIAVASVRSFRRYFGSRPDAQMREVLFRKVLANEAI